MSQPVVAGILPLVMIHRDRNGSRFTVIHTSEEGAHSGPL